MIEYKNKKDVMKGDGEAKIEEKIETEEFLKMKQIFGEEKATEMLDLMNKGKAKEVAKKKTKKDFEDEKEKVFREFDYNGKVERYKALGKEISDFKKANSKFFRISGGNEVTRKLRESYANEEGLKKNLYCWRSNGVDGVSMVTEGCKKIYRNAAKRDEHSKMCCHKKGEKFLKK